MPKIYSIDFRKKVMQFYEEKNHKSYTCRTFKISRTTLNNRILLQNTTGQLKQHKINAGRPTKIKIKDMEDQILYIDESGINTTDTAQYGWSRLLSCIKIRRSWQKIKPHQCCSI